MKQTPTPRGFHVLALITLVVGILLIWVGAAVTTTGAGMAFSDWPLSNGSINPRGWLSFTPQLLEHSHRLLATTVGFLVLAMFLWQWYKARQRAWTPLVLIAVFMILIPAVHAADAITKGSESKLVQFVSIFAASPAALWMICGMMWGAVICWLLWGLLGRRWPSLLKLTAASLVVVVFQAILGGLRVLEVSDPFGVAHGCLGQLFYCLLIAVALVSAPGWSRGELTFPVLQHRRLVAAATVLFGAVSLQLLLGAIVRHTQRAGLAATDILTTGGHLIPPVEPFDVYGIFLHKTWGVVVFTIAVLTALLAWKPLRGTGWPGFLPKLLLLLPVIQITLGVYVLLTRKAFWITNIHVLNGLGILAVSLILAITVWRARSSLGVVAGGAS